MRIRGRRTVAENLAPIIGCVIGPLAMVGVFTWMGTRTSHPPMWIWVIVGLAGPTAILILSLARVSRRGAAEVRAHECRLCLNCRYPLADEEGAGICPEYGLAFTKDGNRMGWEAAYPELRDERRRRELFPGAKEE